MKYKVLFLIFSWCLALQADMEIDGYDPDLHDRFTNHGSFVGSGYDFSGVALSGDARWGTLVSDQVILSSFHFDPLNGAHQYIRFVPGNDSSVAYEERVVVAGQRLGDSDLWIGRLDVPVSSEIASYGFMDQSISDSTEFTNHLLGEEVYMMGRSPVDHSVHGIGVAADQAVGKNLLDGWQEDFNDQIGTTHDMVFAVNNAENDVNHVDHEAQTKVGDSGGPLFRDNGGELELVGINWVSATATFPIGERGFSGFTYIGNYASEINDYIAAVPELNSLGLAGIAAGALAMGCLGRRRKYR